MKPLVRVGCMVVVAAVLATSGCAVVGETPGTTYHRDPSSVRETYDSWLLFVHLAGALESVASQDFARSGEQLGAVHLERAHIPPALVDVARRYVELCDQLARTIETLFNSLEQAERSLASNDLPAARVALDSGRSLLAQARQQLTALEDATLEVFTMLRRTGSGGTTAQLDEARASLQRALAMLTDLTLEYERRMDEVEIEASGKSALARPLLLAQMDRDAAWVGETVVIQGSMNAGVLPLSAREVRISIDGVEAGRTRCSGDGQFSYAVTIPFHYVPLRMVQVSYVPEGDDLLRFQPAVSDDMTLTIRFHQSLVTATAPARLYPGLSGDVSGAVESPGSVSNRPVEMRWRGEVVALGTTRNDGSFRIPITLPDDSQPGAVVLELIVAADDDAVTGPGMLEVDTAVAKLAPRVALSVARFVFVPAVSLSLARQLAGGDFVRMVQVSGEVVSPLPLGVVSMSADWGGRQVRWEQSDVTFQRDVPLELSVWSMGVRTVTVQAVAREPWHRPAETRAGLLVVNLFIPFVWFVALVAAFMVGLGFRRLWLRGVAMPFVPAPALTGVEALVTKGGRGSAGAHLGPRLLLVRFYYRAVTFLQSSLGVVLKRGMTLREYRAAVAGRSSGVVHAFTKLTLLAERALYAQQEPGDCDVRSAHELLENIDSDALWGEGETEKETG